MQRGEANALHARRRHGSQHRRSGLAVQIAAIIHVLAQQRKFPSRRRDGPALPPANIFDGARLFATAHVRNDAIGAEIIATRGK